MLTAKIAPSACTSGAVMWWHSRNDSSLESRTHASLPLPDAIKRTRILVIDDEEAENTAFPFGILRREGYAIDHWTEVKELEKLERNYYDIVVLDIGGVGTTLDPAKQGVAVLQHIKRVNPAQIVVAHSGQSHEPDKIPFFRLADQFVPKPTSAIAWKEIIDDLIQTRITPSHYWRSLRRMLEDQGISTKQIRRLEKAILRSKGQRDTDEHSLVKMTLGTVDRLATIASTVGKIISLIT